MAAPLHTPGPLALGNWNGWLGSTGRSGSEIATRPLIHELRKLLKQRSFSHSGGRRTCDERILIWRPHSQSVEDSSKDQPLFSDFIILHKTMKMD
jgi:hypothetical protein